MSSAGGWQPLSKSPRRSGGDAFRLSPFARLARAHALSVAGDTLIAIALAGSLFFDIDPTEARWRVFAYLAFTIAPFAIVAPLIGPQLDRARGGRRWMVVGANAVRAVVCVFMIDDLDGLLLFPEAFAVLVMGKAYGVARSALVPTVVRTDAELVEANSKLQLLSGVTGFVAAIPAGLAVLIAGSRGVLVLAVIVFVAAALAGLRIPPTQVAASPATEAERAELRSVGVLLAASAMGLVRGIVGFVVFLLAFDLRTEDAPTWHFGVVIALTGIGAVLGSVVAPMLRRSLSEERMLMAVLAVLVVAGLVTAWQGGLLAASAIAAVVATAATTGKLAFDSLVQRDAPDANRGRSFARFETRFQLFWVIGAVIPVVLPTPARVGYLAVAGVAAFALFSYVAGQRAAQRDHARRDAPPSAFAEEPDAGLPSEPDPTVADEAPRADPTAVDEVADDPTVVDEVPGADPTVVREPPTRPEITRIRRSPGDG